jgi:hypothetical protein
MFKKEGTKLAVEETAPGGAAEDGKKWKTK